MTTGLIDLSATQLHATTWPNPVALQSRYRYGRMLYLKADLGIGRSVERLGEYSQQETDILLSHLPEGGVAIDVGANIGTMTVAFARKVGAQGAVFSFEPQPFIYNLLCGNIALNGLLQCQAHRSVVAHEAGIVELELLDLFAEQNFGGYAVPFRQAHGQAPTNVTTLDMWRLNRCDLIKIDVEGMERMVLRGGYGLIRKFHPVLWVECEPSPEHPHSDRELLIWLQKHFPDYTVEKFTTPIDNPGNWLGETEPVFKDIYIRNLLCTPRHRTAAVGA